MKKKILIIALIICLIGLVAVGGTLAYFSTSDTATNKFMIASYDPDDPNPTPDSLFSLKVYEHDKSGQEVEGLSFTDIAPGTTVSKDPTVENTGRYSAWIRVNVELSNADVWTSLMEKHNINDLVQLFGGYSDTDWYRADNNYTLNEEEDTLVYSFYCKKALAKGDKKTLFTSFEIPSEFDAYDMSKLNYFELKVTADAIQEANTGDSAYFAFSNYWK